MYPDWMFINYFVLRDIFVIHTLIKRIIFLTTYIYMSQNPRVVPGTSSPQLIGCPKLEEEI